MQPTVWAVNLKNGLAALFFAKKWRFYNGSEEENYQYQSIF